MTACEKTQSNEARAEWQRLAVGLEEPEVAERPFARERDAGLAEAVDEIDADDKVRFFGERERHAAPAAARVEHAPADPAAHAVEMREDLGAAVVLEERVVVLGPETAVSVLLDQGVIDNAHNRIRLVVALAAVESRLLGPVGV